MVSPLSLAVVVHCAMSQAASAPTDGNSVAEVDVGGRELDVGGTDATNIMMPMAHDNSVAADGFAGEFYQNDNSDGYVSSIDSNSINVAGGYGDDENSSDRDGNIDENEDGYDNVSGDEDNDHQTEDYESEGEDDDNHDNDDRMRDNAAGGGDDIEAGIDSDIKGAVDVDGNVGNDSDGDDGEYNNGDGGDSYYGDGDRKDKGDGDENENGNGDERGNGVKGSISDNSNDDDTLECRQPPGMPSLSTVLNMSDEPSDFYSPEYVRMTKELYLLRYAQIIVDGDTLCRLPLVVPSLLLDNDNESAPYGPPVSEALQLHASYEVPGNQLYLDKSVPEVDSHDVKEVIEGGGRRLLNDASLAFERKKKEREGWKSNKVLLSEEEQKRELKQQLQPNVQSGMQRYVFKAAYDNFVRSLRFSLRYYGFVLGANGTVIVPHAVALRNEAKFDRVTAGAND